MAEKNNKKNKEKVSKKDKILLYISILNGLILTFVINSIENDLVPIKYSMEGKVTEYGEKWTYIIFAVLPIALSICQLTYDFKGKGRIESNSSKKVAEMAIPLLVILTSIVGWIFATVMIRPQAMLVDATVYSWLVVAMGAWMMYVNNFYANANKSGARFKWANDKRVLDKLKLSGTIFGIIGGLIVLICGVIGVITENIIVVSAGLILGVVISFVVPVLVAFIEYKKIPKAAVTSPKNKRNK